MKILQFIYQLGNGGAEKFCVELSNTLARNHEVKLLIIKPIEEWMIPPRSLSKTVELVELNLKKYSFKGFFKIFNILKREKPEVLHIHSSLLFFHLAPLIILFRKIKFIHTIHNTTTPAYQKLFNLLNKLRGFHKNLQHVCISKDIQREFKKHYPKISFHQIDNGIAQMKTTRHLARVNNEISAIKKRNKYLFTAIGNYSVFKNFALLTAVIKRLNLEGHLLSLIIIGEDNTPLKEQWNRVRKHKDPDTHQLGLRSNVADYLYLADALIISSTKEGMPLVALEAMSMGKPIISTPAGGMVDMIENGINGFLAPGFKEEDLYQAVLSFIQSDDTTKTRLALRSKQRFQENYDIKKCGENYEYLYMNKIKS